MLHSFYFIRLSSLFEIKIPDRNFNTPYPTYVFSGLIDQTPNRSHKSTYPYREITDQGEETINPSEEHSDPSEELGNTSERTIDPSEEHSDMSKEHSNPNEEHTYTSKEPTNTSEELTNQSGGTTNMSEGSTNMSEELINPSDKTTAYPPDFSYDMINTCPDFLHMLIVKNDLTTELQCFANCMFSYSAVVYNSAWGLFKTTSRTLNTCR